MQPFVRNLLGRQRKRAIGVIMGHAERTFWSALSPEQQTAFRKTVLDAVGSYHDACLDLIEASVNDGMVVNEQALAVIAEFNENLQRSQWLLRGEPLETEGAPG